MKNSIRTVFIFLGAGTVFYLFMKFSYVVGFLFLNSIIGAVTFVGALIGAIWLATQLDRLIDASRSNLPIQTTAILLMGLFFTYQMFAAHFYSEDYLKEIGLDKVERLFELGEMDLDAGELREQAEEIAVKEQAYAISLYGTNPRPVGVVEFEVLEFERSYYYYEMVIGTDITGESARYYFTREGLDFKLSGNSVLE